MSEIRVEKLSDIQRKALNLPAQLQSQGPWAVWECDPTSFDWHYAQEEKAYIFEGKVNVKAGEEDVEITAGDFVTFPKGLNCTWTVTKKIRKVYRMI